MREHTPADRAKHVLSSCGYEMGGAVDRKEDAAMVAKGVHEHEANMHKGQGKTKLSLGRKAGGHVPGKASDCRPDKRARGGSMNGMVHVDRRYEAEGIDQPHGPEKRADGGKTGSRGHAKGKGKINTVNIIVGKGGDDQAGKQQAAQAGLRAGAQLGARAVAQRLAGAGAGGPPPPGAGGPPPMPPPGAGPGGPPMAGPSGPPPGAMPPRPMPVKDGGHVRMRERSHERRLAGGVVA